MRREGEERGARGRMNIWRDNGQNHRAAEKKRRASERGWKSVIRAGYHVWTD